MTTWVSEPEDKIKEELMNCDQQMWNGIQDSGIEELVPTKPPFLFPMLSKRMFDSDLMPVSELTSGFVNQKVSAATRMGIMRNCPQLSSSTNISSTSSDNYCQAHTETLANVFRGIHVCQKNINVDHILKNSTTWDSHYSPSQLEVHPAKRFKPNPPSPPALSEEEEEDEFENTQFTIRPKLLKRSKFAVFN